MGFWKDANEAEDPDKLVRDVKAVGRSFRTIGKAVRDEVKGDRRKGDDSGRGRRK